MTKLFRLSNVEVELAENRFKKYGNRVLLLSWMPVIGDPLTVVAGILKVNFWLFIILVSIGKFLRYLLVAVTFLGVW